MKRFLSFVLAVWLLLGLWCVGVSAASEPPAAAKVATGTANLHVRAGASTSAAVKAKLSNGTCSRIDVYSPTGTISETLT